MTIIKTTVHNRRIEVPAPSDIPDGAEVTLTITEREIDSMSPAEIARVLESMRALEPVQIPADVAAELDDWERKINQHGIEYYDPSLDHVFP